MAKNKKLNKCFSIILTLMVTISMMIPSMLMPKSVNAESQEFTPQMESQMKSYIGQQMTCDAYAGIVGRSIYQLSGFPGGNVTAEHTWLKNNAEYVGTTTDPTTFNFKAGDIFVTNGDSHIGFIITSGVGGTVIHGGITYGSYYKQVVLDSVARWWSGSKDYYGSSGAGAASITVYRVFKDEGFAKLQKVTKSNKHLTDLCPEQYTIAGAVYGVYSDSACTSSVGSFTTDANGNSNTLKLKPATYYVKETKAPKGYRLDSQVYSVTVTAGQTATVNVADEPVLDPLQWKLVTKKIEDGADKNLSVEGAEFKVNYYNTLSDVTGKTPVKTWTFNADKNGLVLWSDKYLTANSEKLLKTQSGVDAGLIGTYAISETKAPKGLARDEKTVYVRIVQDGNIAKRIYSENPKFDNTTAIAEDGTAWNQEEKTQKVNLKVQKKDSETGETKPQGYGSFKGARFEVWKYDALQLTDVLVGIIETDENGTGALEGLEPGLYTIMEIVAPAGYNKNTNKMKVEARVREVNTAFFDYLTEVPEKPITVTVEKTSIDEVGVKVPVSGAKLELYNENGDKVETWVSDGNVRTFKALPKGNYVIKEVEVPNGYLPLEEDYSFTVKEVEEVQPQDIFNEPIPEVKTVAKFDTGVKESLPEKKVTVLDKFECKRILTGHPYQIKAKLVDKADVNNVIAEDTKEFTPEGYSDEQTLTFKFDASKMEGKEFVVLTELHRLDRKGETKVATHDDVNNIDETVVVPKIKTTATDKKDGGKDLLAGKKETIVDKVKYESLIVGREYTVSGKLMNQETGKPVLDNGKEITAEKKFTPETKDGYVDLEFTFNATALAGKTVVVFEDVYKDKIKVATHADIKDEEQSVYIPKIGTKLTGKDSEEKEFHAFDKIELRDVMKYENLIKGKVYYAKGEIINKKTGKTLQTAEGNFIADETKGEASLDFTINAKDLKGAELVCFEEIYTIDDEGNPDKLVGEHKDINDKGQTVKIVEPKIGTTATTKDGQKAVPENRTITIIDKVAYHDLILGKEYTIKGILMDKTTGKPLMVNGKEVRAEKTFTAKEKNGFEELTFTFDGKGLGGKTVVVFEEVYQDGKLIGSHCDINDLGQSVKITKVEKKTVKTGDDSDMLIYGLGLLVGFGAVMALRVRRAKKNK